MILSFVSSLQDPSVVEEDLSQQDLVDLFTEPTIGEKDGLAFIPATFRVPYRLDTNVSTVNAFVADVDHFTDRQFDELIAYLRTEKIEHYWWETFSHVVDSGHTRARVVIPFKRPAPVEVWADLWAKCVDFFDLSSASADTRAIASGKAPAGLDRACKNPSRLYFLPRCPSGQARAAEFEPGDLFEWEQLAPTAAPLPVRVRYDAPEGLEAPPPSPAKLAAAERHARDTIARHPADANHQNYMVGCVLLRDWGIPWDAALPIAEKINAEHADPSSKLEETLKNAGERYANNTFNGEGARFELIEKLKNPAPPPPGAAPVQVVDWGTLRATLAESTSPWVKKLAAGKALGRTGGAGNWQRAVYDLADDLLAAGASLAPEVLWLLALEPSWSAERAEGRPTREYIEEAAAQAIGTAHARRDAAVVRLEQGQRERAAQLLAADGDSGEWLAPFIPARGPIPQGRVDAVLLAAFRHSRRWSTLRFDTFRQEFYDGYTPTGPRGDGDAVVNYDTLVGNICQWASRSDLPYSAEAAHRALRTLSTERCFDSLRDRWDDLPEWDGVPRLELVASRYLHAGDVPPEYAAQVVRRWLIAMAARAYAPGCQVDTALIIESDQGAKKTSWFRLLAGGEQTYLSTSLTEKELPRRMKGKAVVELDEFEHGASIDSVKAFLTRTADDDRGLYRAGFETLPRRVVIGGTTNDASTLKDPTGNRRFWILPSGGVDLEGFRVVMPQVLAEARAVYLAGEAQGRDRDEHHRWWIDPTEPLAALQAQVAAEHMAEEDQLPVRVRRALLGLSPEKRPEWIGSTWVFDHVDASPGVKMDHLKKGLSVQIAKALRGMFGPPRRKRPTRERVYQVSEELLRAPQAKGTTDAVLHAVRPAEGKP